MLRRLPLPKSAARMRRFLRQYREEAAAQHRGSAFTDKEWASLRRDAASTMTRHDARIEDKQIGLRAAGAEGRRLGDLLHPAPDPGVDVAAVVSH